MNNVVLITIFMILVLLYFLVVDYNLRSIIMILINASFYTIIAGKNVVLLYLICTIVFLEGKVISITKNKKLLSLFIIIIVFLLVIQRIVILDSKLYLIGSSFYLLECISYLVDIYKGANTGTYIDALLYFTFFPTVLSGPIIKWRNMQNEIIKNRIISISNIKEGTLIFLFGALKKFVIANRLAVAVDYVFLNVNAFSWITLVITMFSYSIQLLMDFSGYSDMAIGIAKIFGFSLHDNFNMPYLSANFSDFWKRWHISLSSWLTEYIYIPLGGNKKGKTTKTINTYVTMMVSGFWHGLKFNYLFWGIAHALVLQIQDIFTKRENPHFIKIILVFIIVSLLWIPFRSNSLYEAFVYFKRIITLADGINYIYSYSIIFIVIVIIYNLLAYLKNDRNKIEIRINTDLFIGKCILVILILTILVFGYFGDSSFIYVHF